MQQTFESVMCELHPDDKSALGIVEAAGVSVSPVAMSPPRPTSRPLLVDACLRQFTKHPSWQTTNVGDRQSGIYISC